MTPLADGTEVLAPIALPPRPRTGARVRSMRPALTSEMPAVHESVAWTWRVAPSLIDHVHGGVSAAYAAGGPRRRPWPALRQTSPSNSLTTY